MSKRNKHLQVLVMEYVHSILQMVDNIDAKTINQVVSLIKANIKVLESDVKQSFNRHESQDFNYKDYN